MRQFKFQTFVVHQEILQPQAGAFAHRRRLRRLKMRIGECRCVFFTLCEIRQRAHQADQQLLDL